MGKDKRMLALAMALGSGEFSGIGVCGDPAAAGTGCGGAR